MMLLSNMIMGIGFVCAIYFFHGYMKEKGRAMNWWKWALTVIWGTMVYFWAAFIGTTIGEGAPQAAATGGPFIGVIVAVLGVVLFRFVLFAKAKA